MREATDLEIAALPMCELKKTEHELLVPYPTSPRITYRQLLAFKQECGREENLRRYEDARNKKRLNQLLVVEQLITEKKESNVNP